MTNIDAIKWLENLKKDIGEPTHQSLWHYEQTLVEIIDFLVNCKTKPNNLEKSNNCETCRHYKLACELFSEICKYEPKTKPSGYNLSPFDKGINVRSKNEPQKCSVNGRPYTECSACEHFRCMVDEPQYRSE